MEVKEDFLSFILFLILNKQKEYFLFVVLLWKTAPAFWIKMWKKAKR